MSLRARPATCSVNTATQQPTARVWWAVYERRGTGGWLFGTQVTASVRTANQRTETHVAEDSIAA